MQKTRDSRLLRRRRANGEPEFYGMYSRNIRVEGDGLAYNELNMLRAAALEPVLRLLLAYNTLLGMHIPGSAHVIFARIFAHTGGAILNIFRVGISIAVLTLEICAWPIRLFFGIMLFPLASRVPAGHVYGLACSTLFGPEDRTEYGDVVRRVKVKAFDCEPTLLNAGNMGGVLVYETATLEQASYIASSFKLRQRCGTGPECIWVRGRWVFVSNWYPITITNLFCRRATSWELMDLTDRRWRTTIFDFEDSTISASERANDTGGDEESGLGQTNSRDASPDFSSRTSDTNDVDLGWISSQSDLEEFYNSPLGWNKYPFMRAEGNQIRVLRNDRRALAHFMAAGSSLLLYLQFRDSSEGWLGVSITLYLLLIANYTLVTGYAAEILIGKVSDVVDAKSDRYGVIVTRAIDRGYLRGFHVPDGDWLQYRDDDEDLPRHDVNGIEVNVTCNSFVYQTERGMKIKVLHYNADSRELSSFATFTRTYLMYVLHDVTGIRK